MNDIVQVLRKAKKANQHEQIVMFPFGGGSGYSYSALVNQIGEDVEVIVINPPGHFFNSGKALENIDAMVYLYAKELRRFLKSNPIFFGHSIGGIVAYELCKILEKDFQIKRLVISSVNPPHSTMELVDLRSWMDTETLIQKCTDLGGMPHIFKQEPELLESFINGLRADLKALESYTPPTVENVVKSLINATVLYSDRDYIVKAAQVREWEYYLDCSDFMQFPGDHFYLFDSPNLSSVAQLLANYVKND